MSDDAHDQHRKMDEEDFRAWLIELAHGPVGPSVDPKERFSELADLVLGRIEAWKDGMVDMAEIQALAAEFRAEGEVECATGLQVLVDRGYDEQAHKASREAPLN